MQKCTFVGASVDPDSCGEIIMQVGPAKSDTLTVTYEQARVIMACLLDAEGV